MALSTTYYIKKSQQTIQVEDQPFASGGEGALYQVLRPNAWSNCVAKIIYPHKRTTQKAAKLAYLLSHPPLQNHTGNDASIIWVKELLQDQDGNFVGFLMPRATGEKLEVLTAPKLPKHLGTTWERLRLGTPTALRLRLKVCYNIALAVYWLHSSNRYVLVDIKPDNILVRSNGTVSIVDIDSIEIVEEEQTLFAATVATPEYTPSEYYRGIRPGQAAMHPSWDNFGLAVILYRLLFGIHPFAATAKAPYDQLTALGDKIKMGLFVHNVQYQSNFRVIPPPHQVFYQQEDALKELFQEAFVVGHKHPKQRPDALTWTRIIANHPLILTNRILPSTRLSLQGLDQKNWYKEAVEQARKSQLPSNTATTQKLYLATTRKSFKEKVEENLVQLLNFCGKAAIAIGVGYAFVFILLVIAAFTGGIEDDSQMIVKFLWFTWELIQWFVKSSLFIVFIFSPLLRAVFAQTKETFFSNVNREQEQSARQTQRIIEGQTSDLKERQYSLYTERSRLNTKLRELKNEYYVYQKVKEQRETDFEGTYQASITHTNKKIEEELKAKKIILAQKDQEAHQLIQEEAVAIRALVKAQQDTLAIDPIWKTIRGKSSAEKLLFLKNDASSWEDKSISKEMVYKALQKQYQVDRQAQEQLKTQYTAAHQVLLEAVEEEKININALVGSSINTMRTRIQIDDLLFDKAFLKTLINMEALQAEIKEREKNLEKVNYHLKKVREHLKR